jgi:ABC-2 type transport system ATP-binding protein
MCGSSSLGDVLVRSPRATDLGRLLTSRDATVIAEPDGGLAVSGMDAPRISELAARSAIPVYELTARQASLEEAYMKLADSAVGYHADAAERSGKDAGP